MLTQDMLEQAWSGGERHEPWEPERRYSANDVVRASIERTGLLYRAIVDGRSGRIAPVFPESLGHTVSEPTGLVWQAGYDTTIRIPVGTLYTDFTGMVAKGSGRLRPGQVLALNTQSYQWVPWYNSQDNEEDEARGILAHHVDAIGRAQRAVIYGTGKYRPDAIFWPYRISRNMKSLAYNQLLMRGIIIDEDFTARWTTTTTSSSSTTTTSGPVL